MSRNIVYSSDQIAEFYTSHRRCWQEFYPSERWVFERLLRGHGFGRVLDVGCAAGGLALALAERARVESYTGIDINAQAIRAAQDCPDFPASSRFIAGDVVGCPELADQRFDLVTSLSVADWNIDTQGIVRSCWSHVAPGGHLVISLRLTPGESIRDMSRSFQFVNFGQDVREDDERAPYVVLNPADALEMLTALEPAPSGVLGYGYWGAPSASARTPYDRLVFAVFAVRRPLADEQPSGVAAELHLPADVFFTRN